MGGGGAILEKFLVVILKEVCSMDVVVDFH